MLTRARQAALAEGLTNVVFLNADASEPSFGPASFDAVLASFVVYLLADPQLLAGGGTCSAPAGFSRSPG